MEFSQDQLESAISEAIQNTDTLDLLKRKAELSGISSVVSACREFLKLGSRALVLNIEKRKAIPRQWVEAALKRQNGLCTGCERELQMFWAGREDYAVGDHLIALTQGGEHRRSNIAALCGKCNGEKYNKSLMDHSKSSGRLLTQMGGEIEQETAT